MEAIYRIQVDFLNTKQVNRAYNSFIAEERHTTDTSVSEALEERTECKEGFNQDNKQDWRIGELVIERQAEMKQNMDTQDKDLLISSYLGHGTVRLFRLNEAHDLASFDKDLKIVPGDDTMVCILFVPTYFTVHDLLHFYIGDDIISKQISTFRILRNKKDELGYNFMVLIKFRDPVLAKNFKEEFNGKKFSKVDPETCHVVSIKEVVFKKSLFERLETEKIPYLLTDPFTTIKGDIAPLKEVELPTCPVCLERMDSDTTGLITIPCQHTFHCSCLDKWKNSQCPVCRYSTLRLSRNSAIRQTGETNGCSTCLCHENLWICLICGNIGCGRYNSKHAIQHYEATSHCFAMDMRTQRVWDYAGDNYVHRLVQNEVDGKLVEVQADGLAGQGNSHNGIETNKDSEMASNFMRNKEYHLEYVQVLISQLESQREYYEMKLGQSRKMENQLEEHEIVSVRKQFEQLKLTMKNSRSEWEQERATLKKEVDEDSLIIRGLQENLNHAATQRASLSSEINNLKKSNSELKEQVQDLMFYLQTQEKFKDADESVREGTIVIPAALDPPSNSAKNGRKKKVKKKKKT